MRDVEQQVGASASRSMAGGYGPFPLVPAARVRRALADRVERKATHSERQASRSARTRTAAAQAAAAAGR